MQGFCDDKFAAVREEFEKNFAERGEVGAAVSVYLEGKLVVDLWGGVKDASSQEPWIRDTLVKVFSSTKGMSAACMHVLIDRGEINVDDPVSKYWPEFAANGKRDITVAMVMSHQAGLPYWQAEIPEGGLLDWNFAVSALAKEAPVWEPGTRHGYHGRTVGYLEGEILRRVTGMSIGTFLREELAKPLDADVWIGLPKSEEGRVAKTILADPHPTSAMFAKLMAEPEWDAWKLMRNVGGANLQENVNASAYMAAENPSGGGLATAHGLARLYAPLSLDGAVDGVRIVTPASLPGMRITRSASSCDLMLRLPTTFTLGFSNTWGHRAQGPGNFVLIGERAFGTPGMGGSVGFADVDARMSFAYVMSRHGGGAGMNWRGQSLVDAAYRTLGFTSSPTCWVR